MSIAMRNDAVVAPVAAAVSTETRSYSSWDVIIRVCHWTIVLSFLFLSITGLIILNSKAMSIAGQAKVMMKVIHVYAGYVFAVAMVTRLIWGFVGPAKARWSNILPIKRAYWADLTAYVRSMRAGTPRTYVGHNPMGKLMVTVMFTLLYTMLVTGLVIGGTDIFAWPLGDYFRNWIAAAGTDPATLLPANMAGVDAEKYKAMREFRLGFYVTHEYVFYVLAALVLVHLLAVIYGEVRQRISLVSGMIGGRKHLEKPPVDA